MGIGMVLICAEDTKMVVKAELENIYEIGNVTIGKKEVSIS